MKKLKAELPARALGLGGGSGVVGGPLFLAFLDTADNILGLKAHNLAKVGSLLYNIEFYCKK
ncbi:MAG: hypothetical protein K2N82_00910 [Lachnospiraceae bacterium]|nr:hypothetical protein [Lachnospiraceae bacterium]